MYCWVTETSKNALRNQRTAQRRVRQQAQAPHNARWDTPAGRRYDQDARFSNQDDEVIQQRLGLSELRRRDLARHLKQLEGAEVADAVLDASAQPPHELALLAYPARGAGPARDHDGKFRWNGYGENSRVLARIFSRCQGKAEAGEGRRSGCCHPLGEEGIDTEGLDVTPEAMAKLLEVDVEG